MVKIYALNGKATSGKDTFVKEVGKYLKHNPYYFINHLSIVDIVKDIATEVGWNGDKDDKSRKFLSDLKELIDDYNNGCFNYVCKCISSEIKTNKSIMPESSTSVIFVDMRSRADIEALCNTFDNVKTIWVDRDVNINFNNYGDNHCEDYYLYDITINNNGTLDDLKKEVKRFVESELENE